jgi:two-component system, chemotaxis family, sensor kinase CheA
VIDIVSLGTDILPAAVPGEVRGVTLIDGVQVEVLDLFRLFEASGITGPMQREQKVCALPAGDSWMETILRPIIESAGYRVVRAGEAGADAADVHIINADGDPDVRSSSTSGQILKIRSDVRTGTDQDDSIHRYDHAALLQALAADGVKRKKA